jgi:hypothetical protein
MTRQPKLMKRRFRLAARPTATSLFSRADREPTPISAPIADAFEPTGVSSPRARPFVGYAVEQSAYQARKAELLRSAPGAFVVFVGDEMIGPFPEFQIALRDGLRRFGRGPLFIQQVLAEEHSTSTGASDSCPS